MGIVSFEKHSFRETTSEFISLFARVVELGKSEYRNTVVNWFYPYPLQ